MSKIEVTTKQLFGYALSIIHVQKLLGHKSILNPQIYVNLEQAIFEINEDYDVKIAETLDDAFKLLEVGFEYVADMEGKSCLGSANDYES